MWGLVFRARGVVAQFRRGFSTTSAITYPFPPRTAIIGTIGAILGANKHSEEGKNLIRRIDNSVMVGVRWVRGHISTMGVNNLYGKNNKKDIKEAFKGARIWADNKGSGKIVHLPTPMEFVLYPEYHIAVISEDESLIKEISKRITERTIKFAPYLGVQGALASIELVSGPSPAEKVQNDTETTYTVPECAADVIPSNTPVYMAKVPRKNDPFDRNRPVLEYCTVYWKQKGETVKIRPKESVYKIGELVVPVY